MKFISWNTNGLRACVGKGFLDAFNALDADFFCLQETKLQAGQIDLPLEGYSQYWNYAEKKGYSGTAIFAKQAPVSVRYGLGQPELDTEGRLITLEYPGFFLVTCYTPNAQRGLARIDHRLKWDEAFRAYLSELDKEKPVIACGDLKETPAGCKSKRRPIIVCGDFNCSFQPIDLARPKANEGNAGYSIQERESFGKLLDSGFVDSFRFLHPDSQEYSWWSYRFGAREKNIGWRIDYFLVSDFAVGKIKTAEILNEITGSDHCPILLDIDLS